MKILIFILSLFMIQFGFIQSGIAGCHIKGEVSNGGSQRIRVEISSKIKGGWYKLQREKILDSGERDEVNFTTDFGCATAKRFKFEIEETSGDDDYIYYAPSSSGYTTDTDFCLSFDAEDESTLIRMGGEC